MARLTDVRDALIGIVDAAAPASLAPYRYTPDSASVPAVVALPGSPFATYQRVMGDESTALYRIRLIFLTGRINEKAGQALLDDWASPDGPIMTALFAADIDDAEILTITGQDYGTVRVGAVEYLGFSLLVEIEA